MKTLKKILALALAFALAFSLVACGSDDDSSDGAGAAGTTGADGEATAPTLDTVSFLDENGFYKGVTALNIVGLADYTNITIPKSVYEMSDAELQAQIEDQLAKNAQTKQVTDRAIKDGDTVNIDYVGSVDGKEFEGGSTGGNGTDVTIGVTQYIDDFLQQLIGHKPGETIDINVTFPDSYPNNTSLEGKDALFVTTINYIAEEVTPELTDAYVEETYKSIKGWTTVAEFKNGLKEDWKRSQASDFITTYLVEHSVINETPEICEKYIKAFNKWQIEFMCYSYNTSVDDYYAYYGVSNFDEFYASISDEVQEQIKQDLIFQAICEKEALKPTDDVMLAYFKEYYGESSGETYYKNYCATMDIRAVKHTFLATLAIDQILPIVTYEK